MMRRRVSKRPGSRLQPPLEQKQLGERNKLLEVTFNKIPLRDCPDPSVLIQRLVTRIVKGFPRGSWEKEPGRRNEALDCRVYARAAAAIYGLDRFEDAER